MALNRPDVPMDFRARVDPVTFENDGMVAFYGSLDNIEYGKVYPNVDAMIEEFERVLAQAKRFKEKWDARSNRGNS